MKQEMQVWSVHWEDPLKKEMATHTSIVAWEIPWMEESGGLSPIRSQRVRHSEWQQATSSLTKWNKIIFLSWTYHFEDYTFPKIMMLHSMWSENFQMFKLDLEMAEEPKIKLPTSIGSLKKQESSRKKHLFLLYWLCQNLWLCGSKQTVGNS